MPCTNIKDRRLILKIIISPAKRMQTDFDSMPVRSMPVFSEKTALLQSYLKSLTLSELQNLLKCNDKIAEENYIRYQQMGLTQLRTPAIFAYQGIQYQYMGQSVFTEQQFDYLQSHLRILSGLYGSLRPFDGIELYRLEMQSPVKTAFCQNLYDFWSDDIGNELSQNNDVVINLASNEYEKAARKGVDTSLRWVSVRFCELRDKKLREKGTQVKMARGAMVRFMAEENISEADDLKSFTGLGYRYAPEFPQVYLLVFVK